MLINIALEPYIFTIGSFMMDQGEGITVRNGLSKTLRITFAAVVLSLPLGHAGESLAGKPATPKAPIPSISVRNENNTSKNSDQRLNLFSGRCFRPATGQGRERASEIAGIIDNIDLSSKMGQLLVERASESDIVVCSERSGKNKVDGAAGFYSNWNVVGLDMNGSDEEKATLAVHEILHGVQKSNGLVSENPFASLESAARKLLYEEAAAKSAEIIFAFEAKRNGDSRYWNYYQGFVGGPEMLGAFESAYESKRKDPDSTYEDGLKAGGVVTWQNVMKNRFFLDFYLMRAFVDYSDKLERGAFDSKPILSHGEFPERGHLSGKITDDFNFTENAVLPEGDAIFGGNHKMYFAFQRIEIERCKRIYGSDDSRTHRLLSKARAEKNPYLAVNTKTAVRNFLKEPSGRSLTDVMDKMAEISQKMQPLKQDYPGLK